MVVVRVGERVFEPNHRFGKHDSPGYLRIVGAHWVLRFKQLHVTGPGAVTGCEMQKLAIETEHERKQAAAKRDRAAYDCLVHWLFVAR